MPNELLERLGYIIDLLDDFIDDDELSDADFHTLRPALETLNDVYDEYVPAWAGNAIDDDEIVI